MDEARIPMKHKLKAAARTAKALADKQFGTVDYQTERKIAEIKKLDPIRIFANKTDIYAENGEYRVPVRIFFPNEYRLAQGERACKNGVILFLHGGGWATESVDTYARICAETAAAVGVPVFAVEYRRAPEYKYPTALMDCYAAAEALFTGKLVPGVPKAKITVMGDSAGGNLAAALCLMARDRGVFMPKRQILIYPALWNDYTESSPYASVRENGTGRILTSAKMEEYLTLYENTPKDRQEAYFAPLLAKDLSKMPHTLLLTAELDLLRDEGEDFARRLKEAGNKVELHRILKAQHGFFGLGLKPLHVKESLQYIVDFLT